MNSSPMDLVIKGVYEVSNLIIVESENDQYFIEALIDYLNIKNTKVGNPICNVNDYNCLGGFNSLEKNLKELKLDNYNKIGIILDADNEGISSRTNFINQCLSSICRDVKLNNINELVKSIELDIEIACYIMNIDGSGELETVMKRIKSKDSIYADCLENWKRCLEDRGETISQKDFDKFWVSNYLKFDTCRSSKQRKRKSKYCANEIIVNCEDENMINLLLESNKTTIKKNIWNFEHMVLDELRDFLKLFD